MKKKLQMVSVGESDRCSFFFPAECLDANCESTFMLRDVEMKVSLETGKKFCQTQCKPIVSKVMTPTN